MAISFQCVGMSPKPEPPEVQAARVGVETTRDNAIDRTVLLFPEGSSTVLRLRRQIFARLAPRLQKLHDGVLLINRRNDRLHPLES